MPSSQNLLGQDSTGGGGESNQPPSSSMTVDIKGIGDLMDTGSSETAKPEGPTAPIDTSAPKKENTTENQQTTSSGPRITGSMVPIVTEDSVTRIKNIQTIYLG